MHTKKILGKYEIIEVLGNGAYYAKIESLEREFIITRKSKDTTTKSLQSIKFSYTAQKFSSISHPNISKLKVDEDDEYFYFIQERYQETEPLDSKIFRNDKGGIDYQRLLQCYMQILSAIGHIHKCGFYHGTINPSNILVDYDNRVFVLDFGRSHFYPLLEDADKSFYAPEQLGLTDFMQINTESINAKSYESTEAKSGTSKESDIFSFGLCMLKLLLDNFEDLNFEKYYTNPKDLDSLFAKISEDYELNDSENEIFLLVKQMCLFNLSERISLCDIKEKLESLLRESATSHRIEINLSDKVVEKYKELTGISSYEVKNDIESKIKNTKSFWHFGRDKNGREEIKVACGNIVFCCSAKDSPYLFCFNLLDNPNKRDQVEREGVAFEDTFNVAMEFIITIGHNHRKECENIQELKDHLQDEFRKQELRSKQNELNQQAIATEESLLEAEYKTLQQKKNTQYGSIKEIRKGSDEIVFILLDKTKILKEQEDKASSKTAYIKELEKHYANNLQHLIKHLPDSKIKEQSEDKSTQNTESTSHQTQSQDSKNKNSQNEKNFKSKQKILFRDKDSNSSDIFKAEVVQYNQDTLELTVKREKYSNLNELSKGIIYEISYDYQVEEIIWNKKDRALKELQKSNVLIPNLLRKINNPKELEPNALVEIESFFDNNLDSNQKEAVQKALSLDFGSEILLIQGPPGTGKTTTITEMLRQIKKRHKHYKILIASQSNQAVDNVLEKIAKDNEKILRIGNDESKMSEIARQFTPEKVLNKLIQENRKRIQKNPIKNSNPHIEQKLQELQKGFLESLQKLRAKTSNNKRDYQSADLFLKHCNIIFGTLIGISSWQNFRDIVFDFAIIDEAGRATLSELLVPCIKARKIVLVGDHKQLAPVIDDEVAQNLSQKHSKEEVRASFFERIYERMERDKEKKEHIEHFQHRLTHNYRAHKSICAIYSNAFYDGELETEDSISKAREHKLDGFRASVVWLDTGKMPNKEDTQKGTGKINRCNVGLIERYTRQILNELKVKNLGYSIGIITPYKDQKQVLDSKLSAVKKEFKDFYKKLAEGMGKDNNNIKDYALDIGTVDSFQGSDRDIIIYDCVRCSKSKNNNIKGKKGGQKIDFIADEKRLNVSLSRSKQLLIIIGDMEYLYTAHTSKGENPFEKIIDYIHKHKQDYQIIECK